MVPYAGGSAESCPHCPLEDIRALRCRRAPGVTCLTALETMSKGGIPGNDSKKACGGAMRVAPIALYALGRDDMDENDVALLAGDAARLTHRHPLGFISTAYQGHTNVHLPDDYRHNSFPEKVLLLSTMMQARF